MKSSYVVQAGLELIAIPLSQSPSARIISRHHHTLKMFSFFSFLLPSFLPKEQFSEPFLWLKVGSHSEQTTWNVPEKATWCLRETQSVQQGPITLHATIDLLFFLIWILSVHFTNYNYLTSSEQNRKFKTSLSLFVSDSKIFLQITL